MLELEDGNLENILSLENLKTWIGCRIALSDSQSTQVFETQKNIIRNLEEQLEEDKRAKEEAIKKLIEDISRLEVENDKKTKVLEEIGQKALPEEQAAAAMRYEITRLTTDNLDLRLQVEVMGMQLKKTQRQLKGAREKCLTTQYPNSVKATGVKATGVKSNTGEFVSTGYVFVPVALTLLGGWVPVTSLWACSSSLWAMRKKSFATWSTVKYLLCRFVLYDRPSDMTLICRAETACGVDASPRFSSVRDVHVHPARGLHQQWQEDASLSIEDDQRHPEIHHPSLPRSWHIRHVAGQHLPASTHLETIQWRSGNSAFWGWGG